MAIFIWFAIKPTVETITVLQKKIADSQTTLEAINKKGENLVKAKTNLDNMGRTTRSKLNTAVPLSTELKSLIRSLEQSANTNQATISALQFEPMVIEKNLSEKKQTLEILFTFNVEGEYATLLDILRNINSSPRLISIESIILNKLPESSSILMSVKGRAYYLQ